MLEKLSNAISIGSISPTGRVHDFIKGWGQVTKSGKFVRWDHYTRPKRSKKVKASGKVSGAFPKFMYPMIRRCMPTLITSDLVSVQPLTTPNSHGKTILPYREPPR